jgi:hypothetical protein
LIIQLPAEEEEELAELETRLNYEQLTLYVSFLGQPLSLSLTLHQSMHRFRSLANAYLKKDKQALAAKGIKTNATTGWWGWITGGGAPEEEVQSLLLCCQSSNVACSNRRSRWSDRARLN